jgi:hypothetical protein
VQRSRKQNIPILTLARARLSHVKDSFSSGTPSPSSMAGALLVAGSYAIAGFGACAILADAPDLHSRVGRHLLAGALAIATLVVVEILVALVPLRRGERWAFWAALLPLGSLVAPTMLADAVNVPPQHRLTTLAPFIVGLVLAAFGLFLVARQTRD